MTGYVPLIFMATTTTALIVMVLSLGSHRHDIDELQDDLDRAHQEIDICHNRIDWLAGYPYPEPEAVRDPDPAPTEPIKGRHHQ